jgi:hypothetical protein
MWIGLGCLVIARSRELPAESAGTPAADGCERSRQSDTQRGGHPALRAPIKTNKDLCNIEGPTA